MKAAVHTRYGPPDVVRIVETETPVPGDNQVRVKVYATTVNRTDCGLRAAHPFISRFFTGFLRPKNTILGNEFTGVIDSVGKAVKTFKPGDQVFGISTSSYGAHAEYLCIDEDASIATLPRNLTLDNALAICEGSWYAWNMLKEAHIKPGDKILVNGGSGSIGSAAIQLANSLGAEVTAVTATQHMQLVRELGATHVIDYTREDFTRLDIQFDYIVDAVGKTTFFKCRKLLKPLGIFFSTELGAWMQNPLLVLLTSASKSKKVLFPIPADKKENLLFFRELAGKGQLKPLIDRVFPFKQIVDAYKYVETGQKVGSVVVKMGK